MVGMSVSGLMSGLDTSSLVSQLMSVERQQSRTIVAAQSRANVLASVLTDLNGLVKKMGDLARGFAPTSTSDVSVFNATTVKSSDESIASAVLTGKSATADLSFRVDSVAAASSIVSKQMYAIDAKFGAGTMKIETGGGFKDVTITGGTLSQIADQINDAKAGVHATVLKVNDTQYSLQLTADKTGAASTVKITDGTGAFGDGFLDTTIGKDAKIYIGTGTSMPITSSSNTIKDLVPGLDVTLKKEAPGTTVTITAKPDDDAIAAKAEEFVKAINAALSKVSDNNKPDANAATSSSSSTSSNNAGAFMGNSTTRDLVDDIQDVLVGSSSNLPSAIGISIDRYGAATFDKEAFLKALKDDPVKAKAIMTETATQFAKVAENATDATRGTLTTAIQGQNNLVQDYKDRLTAFEDRMSSTEAMYKAKFDALDALLSKMKTQSDWLSGQLKSLPTSSK